MSGPAPRDSKFRRAAALRAFAFFGLWLILSLGGQADFAAGVVAAALATWASLRLLPPSNGRLSAPALARLILRFLQQAIVAGSDVAWRALDPRLPLRPGFILYRTRLSVGARRNGFCTMASLLPGTLPAESDQRESLLIHCLDVEQPIAAGLAMDEDLFSQALVEANP
jgi:multicomponent Na+:H+ antiporter subunit E